MLIAPFALAGLLLSGLLAYFYASTKLSPAYVSSASIPALKATIKLEFYRIWDVAEESGRFLTISAPTGSFRGEISGFDWSHNARTSVYQTPDHKIAVLGPMESDYLFDPEMVELKELSSYASSLHWSYVGAFDFGGADHRLSFFPASQQSECIPMRTSDDGNWRKMSRGEYRKENCY
ncbi:conserved hypothetical protein [Bradyrhizobium oligotrophicum S58]|uniref:Uncharacterized protein n=1 Tax=Bradyrhizobium oligotrophicum S58 TaxID=1245469 RepID=M4ZFQ4_9BRAD|nr:hypothetical protein [Bradyrhizobium oligotrophicum]BAM92356.1 conserved hypothetical protein [Bradyrhizobium oligotrophicum S58]